MLAFLLTDAPARARMEELALETARTRGVVPLTERLAAFLQRIAAERPQLESRIRARASRGAGVRGIIRDDLDAAAASLALAHLPSNVFERLRGL